MTSSSPRTTLVQTYSGAFSPLKTPNFRIYLSGQAVSLLGTWMQITAQGWVVWELSKSETALGTVALLAGLPLFVLSPWTGVIADRLDRRRLLIGTQVTMMLLAVILAVLVQTNLAQMWHIYVLAMLLGIATALDFPAQQTFIGDLTGMGQIRRAATLNVMMVQVARMLGPMLAGAVLAALGAATAFWINALSFLAVIASLYAVRSMQVRTHHRGNALHEFRDALVYLKGQPRMMDLIAMTAMVTFFVLATLNILPSLASTILKGDAGTYGLLLGASGAGALVSTLVLLPLTQAVRQVGLVVTGGALWMGAFLGLLSASTVLPLSLAAMFCLSLGAPLVLTTSLGVLQQLAPHEMRARIISLFTMLSFGLLPVASVIIGWVAEHLGTPWAIGINSILLVIGAGVMLLRPALRRWELPTAEETAGNESARPETPGLVGEGGLVTGELTGSLEMPGRHDAIIRERVEVIAEAENAAK